MNLEDWIKAFLDLTKIVIWPLTLLIIIKIFKNELKIIINRIQSVSAAGVSVNTANQQQKESKDETEKLKELISVLKNQKDIQTKLIEFHEQTKRDRDWYLLHYHLEKTYRLIFGSQLYILNNWLMGGEQPRGILEAIYKNTVWVNSYPFNNYIGFLENSLLIKYNPSKDTYSLTPVGSLFIQYLRFNNIPLMKQPY